MGNISKGFSLLLLVILASLSLIVVENASGQSKPAIPQFAVELVEKVIDEAPTYTVDPFSGETIIKTNGYHTSYWVVDIKIKNNTPDIYYNYRIKGHFGTVWSVCPLIDNGDGVWTTRETSPFTFVPVPTYAKATNSEYTEVKVEMQSLRAGDQVDVQVQAISGTIENAPNGGYMILTGQGSDWANIQTLTVPSVSVSVSPSPTVPELSWSTMFPLLLFIPIILVVVRKIAHNRNSIIARLPTRIDYGEGTQENNKTPDAL